MHSHEDKREFPVGDTMNVQPEESLRAYVRAFESLDPVALASFYSFPCMFIGPPGVTVVSDSNTAHGMASFLIEHARSQDYRHTEIHDLVIRELGQNLASAFGVFVRFNSNEQEINRFGFAYTLQREEDQWKIRVAIAHEVPHLGMSQAFERWQPRQ